MISHETLKRLTALTPSGHWTDEAQLKYQLASELLKEREMLDAIRDALPEDAPSRYGDITGVSTLDDVKDLIKYKQKAECNAKYDATKRDKALEEVAQHYDALAKANPFRSFGPQGIAAQVRAMKGKGATNGSH